MDSIMKACQKIPNLINSPPYILDILPDIHNHIRLIINEQHSRFDLLTDNDYFQTFISNLAEKLKYLQKVFRNAKGNIFEEKSASRRELIRMSLIFSHLLTELKAFFPEGRYIGNNFQITKKEAASFWKSTFGPQMIVPWHSFKREMNRVHPLGDSLDDETALKDTINLTQNDYISKFEFDIFTRLFQPWDQLLVNWKVLAVSHPGYASFMTYDEVKQTLGPFHQKPGTYLFRLSCTRLGQWAIGYVTENGEILQTIPQNKSLMKVLIDGDKNSFYIYPKGEPNNPDLTLYLNETDPQAVEINEEEYQIYCEMGSSFQLCKICIENEKDTRIEPCNHLICSDCLSQWQSKDASVAPTCPFCRCDIKGAEKIRFNSKKSSQLEEQIEDLKPPALETISSEIEDKPKTPEPSNEIESSDQTELQQTQPPRPARSNPPVMQTYDPRSPPPIPQRLNQIDTQVQ